MEGNHDLCPVEMKTSAMAAKELNNPNPINYHQTITLPN